MAGKVHIVRHGQGYHNEAVNSDPNDPRYRDAELTISGELQCVALGKTFPHMNSIGIIVTSPLRRAVHTALLAFSSIIDKRFYLPGKGGKTGGIDLVLDPNLQEGGDELWNTGSTPAKLKSIWPGLDYSRLVAPWPEKSGDFDSNNIAQRATRARSDLWDVIDGLAAESTRKDVVVVTHGGFMQDLTNPRMDDLEIENARFKTFSISRSSRGVELVLG